MDRAYLIEVARRASGLTQAELATRSGTSQATMSAYERGLKSPTLKVAARILEAAGYDLNLRRLIDWVEHEAPRSWALLGAEHSVARRDARLLRHPGVP